METTTSTTTDDGSAGIAAELELLKSDVLDRVRMPVAKREAIVDAYERSGMSGPAFARHIGVVYSTFATWVQKRRKSRGDCPKAKSGSPSLTLVEAVVAGEKSPEELCEEGSPIPSTVEAAERFALEVVAPGGVIVRVHRREEITLAVALLRALDEGHEGASC